MLIFSKGEIMVLRVFTFQPFAMIDKIHKLAFHSATRHGSREPTKIHLEVVLSAV